MTSIAQQGCCLSSSLMLFCCAGVCFEIRRQKRNSSWPEVKNATCHSYFRQYAPELIIAISSFAYLWPKDTCKGQIPCWPFMMHTCEHEIHMRRRQTWFSDMIKMNHLIQNVASTNAATHQSKAQVFAEKTCKYNRCTNEICVFLHTYFLFVS